MNIKRCAAFVVIFIMIVFFACNKKPMFTSYDGIPIYGFAKYNTPIHDYLGNYLYFDGDLNMIVLIHTDSQNQYRKLIENHIPKEITTIKSVIFKDTEYEVNIEAKKNFLVVMNTKTGAKKELPLYYNFFKKHYYDLLLKFHDERFDPEKSNIFKDIIEILPGYAAEISEVYFSGQPAGK